MRYYSIAIDGPSGAGKSTMAKAISAELGCVYLDTGAIYRTVAYHMILMGISPKDRDGVNRLIDDVNIQIEFPGDGRQHMILNASQVSAHPVVRDVLLDLQRDMAKSNNVIMDGRDIGTVVLPDADVKIFLTASARERAKRRLKELEEKGEKITFQQVLADIEERDERDSTRAIAPLRCAPDAIRVDTSKLNLQQSIDHLLSIIREKLGDLV